MALDPVKNFAISRVATAPSPADSGTTLVVETGDGALFPDPSSSGEYNVVIYPNGEQPTSTNAEIVRVTARTSDTMTIDREEEGTSARTIVEGDIVMLAITAKVIEDLNTVVEALNPSGAILQFAGATAPTGYLLCDGSAISRTTYATLFTAISTTYGVGDGSTTFNLPNLKGKVPVGYSSTETEFDALGETGGVKTVTLTSAQSGLVAHTHNVKPFNTGTGGGYVQNKTGSNSNSPLTRDDGVFLGITESNSTSNASESHSNLQPYIVLNYIIKT
jgi:microcystin-dependent protein